MAITSISTRSPADQFSRIDNMLKGIKAHGFVNGEKRVLGVSEKLPKNNPTVHSFTLDDDEYVIVRLPKLQ